MLAPLLVALLFLAGAVWNLTASEGTLSNALAGSAIAALLLYLAWFVHREESETVAFWKWLLDHREDLARDGVWHQGGVIDLRTTVTSYRITFSCLICTMNFRSEYVVPGSVYQRWKWAQCTLLSLIFGWWGIPHGPLSTIRTLVHNIRGGKKQALRDILAEFLAMAGGADRAGIDLGTSANGDGTKQ